MRERIEERLRELRAELEVGRGMLAELDARRANVNGSMLRIGGAIQALEEILRDGAGRWEATPDTPDAGERDAEAAVPGQSLAVGQA
ncbi:MAG TPA: hypothetical protein VHU19_11170 [Pyrinomonadaceae bacterium]|jgi:hypothetical protein|nr:hypothetical protein [Pyrinomonadaceae bacterium]